ncbi:MAG TPA: SOS response-associated peptidase, partial [Alphaproteobacteria bacterium]|nr:SOS response-associated peptidase [Alphaproteobacteria bacterium]
ARGETVAEKPAFRQAFARRRGLVPADGFTEWREVGAKRKQPLLIRRQDGAPMAFAALWEVWSRGGAPVLTCSIVTTGPNAEMAAVHDRMPVILDPADFALWLDPAAPAPILQDLLRPAPDGLLRIEAGAQPPGPAQMVLL